MMKITSALAAVALTATAAGAECDLHQHAPGVNYNSGASQGMIDPPHPACTRGSRIPISFQLTLALSECACGALRAGNLTQKPRWLRDLVRFLPLRSQFVLSGNVRDLHIHEPAPGEVTAVPLATILVDQLKGSGYQRIVTFDPVAGFRSIAAPGASAEAGDEFLRGLGLLPSNGAAQGGIDLLVNVLERFVGLDGTPAVLIVDFASRLIVRHEALSQTEHQLFSRALVLSHSARTRPGRPRAGSPFSTP